MDVSIVYAPAEAVYGAQDCPLLPYKPTNSSTLTDVLWVQ